jgi:hypothetical protein
LGFCRFDTGIPNIHLTGRGRFAPARMSILIPIPNKYKAKTSFCQSKAGTPAGFFRANNRPNMVKPELPEHLKSVL